MRSWKSANIARILNDGMDLVQLQLNAVEQGLVSICLCHPQKALSWLSMPGSITPHRLRRRRLEVLQAGAAYELCRAGTEARPERDLRHPWEGDEDGLPVCKENIIQGASSIFTHKHNPSCPLSRSKEELLHHGKAAVAVANHVLGTGLALLHHHDIYCAAKEDGFEKLKAKLSGYKLSALSSYLPQ